MMAEPSYYPLSPLKSPFEGATSPSPEQPSTADLPYLADSVGVEVLSGSRSSNSMLLLPSSLRPQLLQKCSSAGRPHLWRMIKTPLEMALLPLVAIGYLAFCYTVHGKVVPINTYGLYAVTPQHSATIKGGITSISIIIVSIALYPIYSVVSTLKSEEFFRVLAAHSDGVPLGTINQISTPSFGNIDMLIAMWRHTCSNYYILAIVASLLVWIVATLAPGALTINNVLSDGELMAIAIGAVSAQSVLNGTYPQQPAFNASLNSVTAASITWAEMGLGVQYSFGIANTSEPDYAAYIAPVPLDLSTTTSARWLTDVIGINPTCSWASTNLTTPVQVPVNSSAIDQYFATAYLFDFNLDVQLTATDMSMFEDGPFATVKDPTSTVTNHTTHAPASDGSTVFLLGQCQSGCVTDILLEITLDLTGIDTTFTIALTDKTWTMAVLVCIPNITIETHEVRNNGHGVLSVQPLPAGSQLKRQGNLNPVQTTALFSIATLSLTQSAGALSGTRIAYSQLGSQVQGDVLFGKVQFEGLPGTDAPVGTSVTLIPAPIKDITKGYTQILQSASKAYLAGYLGTAYVPGRVSASELVFAASVPNLAISTAVFVLLIALIIFAHFRPAKGMEFTLVNVATAVHGSELPAQFAQTAGVYGHTDVETEDDPGTETDGALAEGVSSGGHQDIVKMLAGRRIFMQRRVDGSPVLHLG